MRCECGMRVVIVREVGERVGGMSACGCAQCGAVLEELNFFWLWRVNLPLSQLYCVHGQRDPKSFDIFRSDGFLKCRDKDVFFVFFQAVHQDLFEKEIEIEHIGYQEKAQPI